MFGFDRARSAVADVKVAAYREEPRAEFGVRSQLARVRHESQPRLFCEIAGDVTTPGQPSQKVEQARIERTMRLIEGVSVAVAQPGDKFPAGILVHIRHNARVGHA